MAKIHDLIRRAYEKGYRVTDDGSLIGLNGKPRKISASGKQKYPRFSVNFQDDCSKSGVYGIPVHQFAAYCFYGEEAFNEELVVRHLNGNVLDISRDNIALGTPSENERDKSPEIRSKTAKKARESQGVSMHRKFTVEQVKKIKRLLAEGKSGAEIGRIMGVNRSYIYPIKNGKHYAEITLED